MKFDAARAADVAESEEPHRHQPAPTFGLDSARAERIKCAPVVVVTSATNNSPLHRPFWRALTRYAKARKAELVVAAVRYRNPTSIAEDEKAREKWWWPKEVVPHLVSVRTPIHPRIAFFADVPIQPTAADPLTGLHAFARGDSAIFAHPQVAMETVPAPHHSLPAILHTTGSVSRPLYSESKAGARGAFHHTLGACILERDGKRFHLRHVTAAADGSFQDLDRVWSVSGSRRARAAALVTGDTHVDHVDPDVVRATYGPQGRVALLRPEVLVWHDVLDFASRSHHHGPLETIATARAGRGSVRWEPSSARVPSCASKS